MPIKVRNACQKQTETKPEFEAKPIGHADGVGGGLLVSIIVLCKCGANVADKSFESGVRCVEE